MDLWQLNVFCKVVELKSFSRAGKMIHLSQPTVSSHIKDLEAHFGCRLIDRLSKEVIPTKAGELLYAYARKLIALRDEAEAAMAEFQGNIKGRLLIGGSTIPGGYILPKTIGAFVKKFPEVTVSLTIGDTEKVINDVISGILELGIVGASISDNRLIQEKLIEDEMRLVVPCDHKWAGEKNIGFEKMKTEPFIIRESGSGTLKSMVNSFAKSGHSVDDLNIVAEMGSTNAVCQGIKNGLGLSIVSAMAVSEDVGAGRLHTLTIDGMDLKRNFYLTRYKYKSTSPLGLAFIEFLKSNLK